MNNKKRILLAITGASGSIYAQNLLNVMNEDSEIERIYVVCTTTAIQVINHELKTNTDNPCDLKKILTKKDTLPNKIRIFNNSDLYAPIASGSAAATHTIILPCSMGTMARVAHGISSCLIERSADVALKQKYPLLICPRETPFNHIHIKNMLALSEAGAHLIPLMPAFYQKPESIEDLINFMTGKILEALGLTHELYKPWNSRMR